MQDLALSGGGGIVIQHAARLTRDHGIEGTIVRRRDPVGPEWPYPGLEDLRVLSLDEARGERFDLAIATWWETALDLFDLEAERYAYFLQLLEDSHYPPGSAERVGFHLTYGLPVRFITAASWITRTVERMQPGNPAFLVLSGIDKEVFAPPAEAPPADGPLRVVIEGGVDLIRKGVPHALEAVGLMDEPRHVTLVTPGPPATPHPGVDEHVGGIPHTAMAELFRRSHVLLKLSRAEGMYGPPLEAFHGACTVVTNPVTGHEEYVRHGENALVVDWDDPVGTARALDLLARDRDLLQRLRAGALETARAWPDWETSTAQMADALRRLLAEPPPAPRGPGLRATAGVQSVLAQTELRAWHERQAYVELEELRGQRAVQTALRARRYALPVLVRAKALRSRLGRR
jgi:glycosyltransferase involved in cell wall biosynthesis